MIANSIQASVLTRKLPLSRRRDLSAQPLQFGGRRYWGIKDPVSLRYFRLRDEEYCILNMLDGNTSLTELQQRFEREFAPKRLSIRQIQAFLGMLHEEGLIVADAPGQAEELLGRRGRQRRRARWQRLSNLLAIRFRGLDPEPILRRLYPKCRWMFSVWFAVCCLTLAIAALMLTVLQYDALRAKMPGFYEFFSARNVVWFVAALAMSKVLHEFGHALACKHFGGECHEMGVMLLVFTPCLYCNVSDAWMLPNKWHRAAIGAAGIIVEVVLASVCMFLWFFSEPGLLNALCLNMMFVCSVSTILFNGNPLLRYDGYYILADVVEVPNLRQQSTAIVQVALARWFLGTEPDQDHLLPERHRGLLAIYAITATVYRWFVVIVILWFCHAVLKPYGFEVFAQGLALMVLGGGSSRRRRGGLSDSFVIQPGVVK